MKTPPVSPTRFKAHREPKPRFSIRDEAFPNRHYTHQHRIKTVEMGTVFAEEALDLILEYGPLPERPAIEWSNRMRTNAVLIFAPTPQAPPVIRLSTKLLASSEQIQHYLHEAVDLLDTLYAES